MDFDDFLLQKLIMENEAEQLYRRDVWRTQDGVEIPLDKITDKHLQNIINMIVREEPDFVNGFDAEDWLSKLKDEQARRLL